MISRALYPSKYTLFILSLALIALTSCSDDGSVNISVEPDSGTDSGLHEAADTTEDSVDLNDIDPGSPDIADDEDAADNIDAETPGEPEPDATPDEPDEPEEIPAPCTENDGTCLTRLEVEPGVFVKIHRSHSLHEGHPVATRAVIGVHGAGRNAPGVFKRITGNIKAQDMQDEVIAVAVQFVTIDDDPADDEAYWTAGGWKRGHLSPADGPSPRISSYEAIDKAIKLLADQSKFPAMEKIVVSGHSAGGQVAHRYAASNPLDGNIGHLKFRYVPANPSTFLYLTNQRPSGSSFAKPNASDCPDYNDWHYGLSGRNNYATRTATAMLRENLSTRDVHVLLGDEDTGSKQLDQTCGAKLQGTNRFDRGKKLIRYMNEFYPDNNHTQKIVSGVAHAGNSMFGSDHGIKSVYLW